MDSDPSKTNKIFITAILFPLIYLLCYMFVGACLQVRFALQEWNETKQIQIIEPVSIPHSGRGLVPELIGYEIDQGVTSDGQKAMNIYHHVLQEADSIYPPATHSRDDHLQYLQSIGKHLGQYFSYEAHTGLSEGLARQAIDCDLRAFMYHDIAAKHGVELNLVHSPGHAFIGWNNQGNGEDIFWETTSQFGHEADFRNTKSYIPSKSKYDYVFSTDEISLANHKAVSLKMRLEERPSELTRKSIEAIGKKYSGNTLTDSLWLYAIGLKHGVDSAKYHALGNSFLNTERYDLFIRRMMLEHYDKTHQPVKAWKMYESIPVEIRYANDFLMGARNAYGMKKVYLGAVGVTYKAMERWLSLSRVSVTWDVYVFYSVLSLFLAVSCVSVCISRICSRPNKKI